MYQICLKQYNGSTPVKKESWIWEEEKREQIFRFQSFPCQVQCVKQEDCQGEHVSICVEAKEPFDGPISISLEIVEEQWNKNAYVFMPAAVYDGNRMTSKYIPYPPYWAEKTESGWDAVITDIPHLSKTKRNSKIQLLSGDMSTPAMGYFDSRAESGMLLFARQKENERYTGFTVEEDGNQVIFGISIPGVREEKKYFFGELADGSGFYPTCDVPSCDEGILLGKGDLLQLEVKCCRIRANTRNDYFEKFNLLRENLEKGKEFYSVPFSKAYQTVKEKCMKMNYSEEGYLQVGIGHTDSSCWQSGWVGGGMNTCSYLMEDDGIARERAYKTLQFIVKNLQEENGWYVPMYAHGKKFGDAFDAKDRPVLLVRKDADLLYFMAKQAIYLRAQKEEFAGLEESIVRQADALIRLFQKNGQLGQFIDTEKEELLVGGTASAAIAAGALALTYEYTGKEEYLEVAEALGDFYWNDYLKKGILNGGPGEICQASDSESSFGYLESCVQLYETTGKEKWLQVAKEAFEFAITWVVSYDFSFPENSAAARIDAHTRGTVFANVQNKHSAPGICTLSGNSMLKLYRFTGDEKYLKWMARIAHALPQFVSLPERPIDSIEGEQLPPGFMNERVQMSDWEGAHTVGEFLYGSNWPETAMLLTYVEIPGIYVDLDRAVLLCCDHVKAELVACSEKQITLRLANLTPYDAVVNIMTDHSSRKEPMGHCYYDRMKKAKVPAATEITITIEERESCLL
ncbi:MAG: hypothetical protein PHQ72_02845 [Hespellia sp.]|nr:hypothetical protein [Hespellia sp.]